MALIDSTLTTTSDPTSDLGSLQRRIDGVAKDSLIPASVLRDRVLRSWQMMVDSSLADNVLTEGEEQRLLSFMNVFGLTEQERNANRAMYRLTMHAAIRDVLEDKIPNRLKTGESCPFNLQKSEQLAWLFPGTRYFEERVHRQRVGGFQGFSVRVARGVYYHAGGFRGRTVETQSMDLVDTGFFGVTSKQIYFSGAHKAFRIPYPKIINFSPYSDGIGVHKDGASAKAQNFLTGDGWFVFNLVTNLARISSN